MRKTTTTTGLRPPTLSRQELDILMMLGRGETYGARLTKPPMVSGAQAAIPKGSVYVTLQRMLIKGYLTSRVVRRKGKFFRRLYRATPRGRVLARGVGALDRQLR